MSTLTKIALAGATGNLGPAILKQLLDAGLQVTVLTRKSSSHQFPQNVTVAPVDYESLDSLVDALKGQDAVVSTLSTLALTTQLLLVDAAAKAGIKRFIPSEFGSDTLNAKNAQLPAFKDKVAVQQALKKYAEDGTMTYTLINNGPFFDWGLQVGFIQNPGKKTAVIYDGGDRTFSTTTLPTIGKAVVGVLRHPQETANRAVYVQDTALTANELLARSQKATGGAEGWTVKPAKTADLIEAGYAELEKENPDMHVVIMNFVNASVWGEGYGSHFQNLDNELLGIKPLTDDEVQAVVERYAK